MVHGLQVRGVYDLVGDLERNEELVKLSDLLISTSKQIRVADAFNFALKYNYIRQIGHCFFLG